jgi:hypothetical protein
MHRPSDKPSAMEIRVIERDGRRWLQQHKNKPGGLAYEYEWVDVCEIPMNPVRELPTLRAR